MIYRCVSTERQEFDSQAQDLAQCVSARGWQLVETYEEKMTGARDRRPELMRLLADARRRRFRAVAVWSLDRFGRGLRQIVTNVYELAELGVEFACVKQAIDLSTMQGRMVLYVFAMLAEIERELNGERVKAGLVAARAQGSVAVHSVRSTSGTSRREDLRTPARRSRGSLTAPCRVPCRELYEPSNRSRPPIAKTARRLGVSRRTIRRASLMPSAPAEERGTIPSAAPRAPHRRVRLGPAQLG